VLFFAWDILEEVVGKRSSGGSQAIRLRRNIRARKDQKAKDKDTLESLIKSLGDVEAANIKMTWEILEGKGTMLSSEDLGVSNGIIATLIGQNYSYNSIRKLLGCGISKISQVKKDMEKPNRLAQRGMQTPWHAANKEDLERIKASKTDWNLEDGFPCAHRRHDPNELPVIIPKVTVRAQDFGGSLTTPNYGYRRPSADYFNSNLIVQNFVIADITNGTNNIYFYDESTRKRW